MRFVGIIPARFGSTRLEGKPLLDIHGKPMIQRVYEQASKALEHVFVATDDERIKQVVKGFGGNAVMTRSDHQTGTNRCLEAWQQINHEHPGQFDAVINVQGDEPMLEPSQLADLMNCFQADGKTELATLVIPVNRLDDLYNESEVFVAFDRNKKALYFSRAVIPHVHNVHKSKWMEHRTYYKHVGLYAYRSDVLETFAELPQSGLELAESLEQNRWLEHGGEIRVAITQHDSIPVDTIDDLERVRELFRISES